LAFGKHKEKPQSEHVSKTIRVCKQAMPRSTLIDATAIVNNLQFS